MYFTVNDMTGYNGKKLILGTVLAGTIALIGMQSATARPYGGGFGNCNTPSYSDCNGYGCPQGDPAATRSTAENLEARDKFMAETQALRREMAI